MKNHQHQQSAMNEENAKRLVRKATKLQQRQLMHLLAPFIVNVENNGGSKSENVKKCSPSLRPSASSSGNNANNCEENGDNEIAENGNELEDEDDQLIRLCTIEGEPLQLDCQWGTQLDQDDTDWVFQLFRRNMRQLYLKSQWGYDECLKLQELQATTARFLILRHYNSSRPIAYSHFRFVDDDGRPVLYCYEIQVENDYQQKGAGTLLIRMMEQLGKSTQMEAMMSTVFAFNSASLAFFHKLGFRTDRTCLFGKECGQECEGRDFVILYKRIDGKEETMVDGNVEMCCKKCDGTNCREDGMNNAKKKEEESTINGNASNKLKK